MRFIYTLSISLFLLSCSANGQFASIAPLTFYHVPQQHLDLFKAINEDIGHASNPDSLLLTPKYDTTVAGFDISRLISFREYKQFLQWLRDSASISSYYSSLPDSGMTTRESYQKYISDNRYDDFPVLGVSWNNALHYCEWKSMKDNYGDSLRFVYRLPTETEWLCTYKHCTDKKINNDLSKNYSDWLLNAMVTNLSSFQKSSRTFDLIYFQSDADPITLTRKLAIGNSYLFQTTSFGSSYRASYYAARGYRHIAFRMVKEKIKPVKVSYAARPQYIKNYTENSNLKTKNQ